MKAGSGRAALLAALLLAGRAPGASLTQAPGGAPPKPAPEAVFGERIDVRAVDVEVVVTDAAGKRVRGLAAADFRLLVDGKEERIDSFAEVSEGQTAPPAVEPVSASTASAPGTAGGAAAGTAPPPALAPARVATHYLVFIDDAFAVASQRNAALSTLERDLALLTPGDRMAVVAYDGQGVTVLAPWTADAAALRKAFAVAAARPARGARIVAERRGDQRASQTTYEDLYQDTDLLGVNPFGLEWQVQHQASGVGRVVTAAADTLRGMPRPPGRRVMMLLAGGWPWEGDARDRQTVELPVTFGIPSEVLTRLPGSGRGYPLEGLLAIASLDAAGGRATLPGQTLRGTLPEPPRPGVGVRIRSTLRLRNAPQRLVFTVTGTGPGGEGPIWTDLDFQP